MKSTFKIRKNDYVGNLYLHKERRSAEEGKNESKTQFFIFIILKLKDNFKVRIVNYILGDLSMWVSKINDNCVMMGGREDLVVLL